MFSSHCFLIQCAVDSGNMHMHSVFLSITFGAGRS